VRVVEGLGAEVVREREAGRRVQEEDAVRVPRQVEDLAVQRERVLVERDELRVVRMLDDAAVAARGAGRDPAAIEDRDARAGLGEERGRRAADDPRA
jgi:hypothetical protein